MFGSSRRTPAFLPAFCVLMFFVGFEMGGFQFALRSISTEYAVHGIGSGLLVAAQYSSVIVMPLVFGHIADRVGKRIVLLCFCGVFVLGCALTAFSGGVAAFALGAFLIGAGYSVCETAGSAALSDLSREDGARWVNFSQGALSFGAVISPILTQVCTKAFGSSWRLMFFVCLVGAMLSAVLLFFSHVTSASKDEVPHMSTLPIRQFHDLPFTLFFFSILLYVGLENGFGYFTESLFSLELGTVSLGAYAISAYWASMACSRLVFGVLRVKPERLLIFVLGASALLFLALSLANASIPAFIICALIGFAFGPVWSILMSLAAARNPSASGGTIGLMSAGCGLGGAVFPALMGLISDSFNLRAAFLLLALTAAIAAALSLAAKLRQQKLIPKG
jgi:MFS family permease